MSKALLVIISGPPCTGKTTLGKKIAREFNLPLISKDEIKESLFDSLGTKDREWSKKLGIASFELLYRFIKILLLANTSFIIETPLKPEYDEEKFLDLKKKFGFEVIQLMCKTDGEILFERFKKRSESGKRHPGHVDSQNYDEFKDILLKGEQQALDLEGEVFDIDTTDFESIDYDSIFNAIKSATNIK
jgi:adenylate kinase family enzyme